MIKKMSSKIIIICILLPLVFLYCGETDDTDKKITGTDNEVELEVQDGFRIVEGSATIKVKAPVEITQIDVTISSSDIKNPIKYDLIKDEEMWVGIIGDLPIGDEKTAIINAYNKNNELLYTGKSIFYVIGNNNITVIIQLNDKDTTSKIKPFIESVSLAPQKVSPGDEINLDVIAFDQDSDDEINFKWTSDGGSFDDNSSATPLWTSPSESGIYELTVTAIDSDENVDVLTIEVEVDDIYKENNIPVSIESHCHHCWHYHHAPKIKSVKADPTIVKQGKKLKLSVDVKDKHEQRLKYKWWISSCNSSKYGTFTHGYEQKSYFRAKPDAPTGYLTMKVKVCNWYYCTVGSKRIKIEKADNSAPKILSVTATPNNLEAGDSTQLNVVASDADSDKLTYSWSSNCSGLFDNKNISNPKFTVSSGLANQTCSISTIVSDGKSNTSKSVSITVLKKNNLPSIKSLIIYPDELDRNETLIAVVTAKDADGDTLNYSWTSTCSGSFDFPLSNHTTFNISATAPYGICTITAKIDDGKDHVSESRNILIRKLNSPPVITMLYANQGTLDKGETTGLFVDANDSDGDSLTYQWTTDCPGTFSFDNTKKPTFTVDNNPDYGTCSITAAVSDGEITTTKSLSLFIEEKFINTPPEILDIIINPLQALPGETVNLNASAIDADGHILTYQWTSSCHGNFNDPSINNPTFNISSNALHGNCSFTVTVSDNEDQNSGSVSLTILDSNSPPTINLISAHPDKPDKGESTQIQIDTSDTNGDPLTYSWSSNCDGTFNNGSIANPKFTIANTANYGQCMLKVIVNDGKISVYGFRTINIERKNLSPMIESIKADPVHVDKNESTQLQVNASDPDGDNLFPVWSTTCDGTFDDNSIMNPVFKVSPDAEYSTCTLTVVISDGENETSGSLTLSIEEKNIAPSIDEITATPTQVSNNEPVQLNVDASDANGDILNYTWSANCSGSFDSTDIKDPIFTVASNTEEGECTLSIEISDGKATTNGAITINIGEPTVNQAPKIMSSFQANDNVNPGKPLLFIIRAKDPDGTNLFFSWSSTSGNFNTPVQVVTDQYTQSTVIWTAPSCGIEPIIVKVTITDEDGISSTKDYIPITLIGGVVCTESDPNIGSKIQASDINENQNFGFSVSMSGTYAISGAYGKTNYSGAAYIYELSEGQWIEKTILESSDKQNNDFFGYSVDINGNYAIVGAIGESGGNGDPYKYCGAAYIFERNSSGNWVESAILHASDMEAYDRFGTAVAIDGNYAIVGAKYEDGGIGSPRGNSGCAYVFEKNQDGSWVQAAILRPFDGGVNDYFGISVDLHGNNAIIGATGKDVAQIKDAGGAYIFTRKNSGEWEQFSILTSPEKDEGDMFGNSVSIDGNYAVIGAYMEDGGSENNTPDSGTVYVYNYNFSNNNWVISAILRAQDRQTSDYFGTSVSIKGKYILVGSQREDGGIGNPTTDSGSAYIYKRGNNQAWSNLITLYAPDKQNTDMLGISVSISDNYGILGAYGENGGAGDPYSGAGAAYILNLND